MMSTSLSSQGEDGDCCPLCEESLGGGEEEYTEHLKRLHNVTNPRGLKFVLESKVSPGGKKKGEAGEAGVEESNPLALSFQLVEDEDQRRTIWGLEEEDDDGVRGRSSSPPLEEVRQTREFKEGLEDFEGGRCFYRCLECDNGNGGGGGGGGGSGSGAAEAVVIRGRHELFTHVMERHNLTVKQFRSRHKGVQLLWRGEKIACRLCREEVYWDKFLFVRHLKKRHPDEVVGDDPGKTLERYFHRFVFPSRGKAPDRREPPSTSVGQVEETSEESLSCRTDSAMSHGSSADSDATRTASESSCRASEDQLLPEAHVELGEVEVVSESRVEGVREDVDKLLSDQEVALMLDDADLCEARPNSIRLLEYPLLSANYDKCVYMCALCQQTGETEDEDVRKSWFFTSKRVARAHIYRSHGLSVRDYCRRFGNLRVLENHLMCQLCGNEKLMDSLVLHQHMMRTHSISLLMYHHLIAHNDDSYFLNVVYKCTACNGHVGVEYVAMMNHIKSVHNLTKPEYLEKHGSIEYAVIYHRCLYCGQKFKSGEMFKRHVEGVEEVSASDYKAHLLERLKNPSNSTELLPRPLKETFLPWTSKGRKKTDPKPTKPPLPLVPAAEQPPDFSNRFQDGCLYLCFVCEGVFCSKTLLRVHLNQAHAMTLDQHKKQRPDTKSLVHRPWFFCLECGHRTIHSAEAIRKHFRTKHEGMSLGVYYEKYKQEVDDFMRKKLAKDSKSPKTSKLLKRLSPQTSPLNTEGKKEEKALSQKRKLSVSQMKQPGTSCSGEGKVNRLGDPSMTRDDKKKKKRARNWSGRAGEPRAKEPSPTLPKLKAVKDAIRAEAVAAAEKVKHFPGEPMAYVNWLNRAVKSTEGGTLNGHPCQLGQQESQPPASLKPGRQLNNSNQQQQQQQQLQQQEQVQKVRLQSLQHTTPPKLIKPPQPTLTKRPLPTLIKLPPKFCQVPTVPQATPPQLQSVMTPAHVQQRVPPRPHLQQCFQVVHNQQQK